MKVLIIGGGGREHALAWKAAQSPLVTQVFVAPGNAGTRPSSPRRATSISQPRTCRPSKHFAKSERIDLAIVGPEAPLVAGVVDRFQAAGLRCFGPIQRAAQLEGSKAYTKEFLSRHRIPTAASRTFTRETFDARYVEAHRTPIVVKASGLAAGKGVVIAEGAAQAIETAQVDVCRPVR